MQLVTTELGQALQLFVIDELRPMRGFFVPDVIRLIAERYRFAKVPDVLPTDGGGHKFEVGVIKLSVGDIPIQTLEIYGDGIIINVRNTDDADSVMDDLLEWSSKTFGTRPPPTTIPRQYTSHLVVDFDKSISGLFKDFRQIHELIAAAYKSESSAVNYPLYTTSISIAADPKEASQFANTRFAIESRAGYPYSDNRYFSIAPLTTDRHLGLLEQIESVLKT